MNVYHISIGDKSYVWRRLFLSRELAEIRLRHLFDEDWGSTEIVKLNCLNMHVMEKIPNYLFVLYRHMNGCFDTVSATSVHGRYLDQWPLIAKIINPGKGETTQKFFTASGMRIEG